MSAGVRWLGMTELQRALKAAPVEIRTEALQIVRQATQATAADITTRYAVGRTGNLRGGVRTEYPTSDVLVGIVRSTAPHAHLWEFGTKRRQNSRGANRGRMPARPTTPGVARHRRAQMFTSLIALVRRLGFEVRHDV